MPMVNCAASAAVIELKNTAIASGRDLFGRDTAIGKARHEKRNFLGRQLSTIALFTNDIRD